MPLLTKSKYLYGLQCPRLLWIAVNKPELLPKPDASAQYRFDQGYLVEDAAKSMFDGIEVSTDFKEGIEQTKELIKKKQTLFEPSFLTQNLYSRADILIPINNQWDIIEVKSSTKVKDINIEDLAFQKHVYELSGLKIRKCILAHINPKYVRQGEIEPDKLIEQTDITEEVNNINVKANIKEMFNILNRPIPAVEISPNCSNPYACPFKDDCWKDIPKNSVLNFYNMRNTKSFGMFNRGIKTMDKADIPLTELQEIQKKNKLHIDKEKIKEFLTTLKPPLYFLDFETFTTAIPLFDNIRPYQQVPCQYSLHADKHHEFIETRAVDPRKEFITNLIKVIGDKGSVIVYNQSFEKTILKNLAEAFPEYKVQIDKILERIVDLRIPFKEFSYYNPVQEGDCSLKTILPILTGKDYSHLDIQNGDSAVREYLHMIYDATPEEASKIKANLLKYCELDTEGMVWILDALKKLV